MSPYGITITRVARNVCKKNARRPTPAPSAAGRERRRAHLSAALLGTVAKSPRHQLPWRVPYIFEG